MTKNEHAFKTHLTPSRAARFIYFEKLAGPDIGWQEAVGKTRGRRKRYYNRKLEEGKPKMLALNNIRNKLVLRLAAVIKNNSPYQKVAA